jgi:hypothetical protein
VGRGTGDTSDALTDRRGWKGHAMQKGNLPGCRRRGGAAPEGAEHAMERERGTSTAEDQGWLSWLDVGSGSAGPVSTAGKCRPRDRSVG